MGGREQYHRQRNRLLRDIISSVEPLAVFLPEGFEPFCLNCGARKSEVNELHVDHPNGNPEETDRDMSGWDYFYMYRRQHRGGVKLWPLCVVCHFLVHRVREDAGDVRLSNHRKYLEEYESVSPGEELARRRERKQDRLVSMVRGDVDGVSGGSESVNGRESIFRRVRDAVPEEGIEVEGLVDLVDADRDAVVNAVEELKRTGELFEVSKGRVKKI